MLHVEREIAERVVAAGPFSRLGFRAAQPDVLAKQRSPARRASSTNYFIVFIGFFIAFIITRTPVRRTLLLISGKRLDERRTI
jgi:hypothetical protein